MSSCWTAVFIFFCCTFVGPGVAVGNPIYQINFSGTIGSGTLTDLQNDNKFYSADLTGMSISGTLTFDFGLAPPPVITNSGGFITTTITGDNGPVFITERVMLPGLSVPANALPVPTTFALTREAPPAGATIVNPSVDHQLLSFSTQPNGFNQAILPSLQLFDQWNTDGADVSREIDVALGLSSTAQFLPPTGGVPASWTLSNSAIGSTFAFQDFFRNPQSSDPILYGVTTDYQISGTFLVSQASGGFVAPEPASIWLAALGLGLVAVFVYARRPRRSPALQTRRDACSRFSQDIELASGPFHCSDQRESAIARDR